MAIAKHPFEFKTRYRDLMRGQLDSIDIQLFEERDRDLEDFLATVGGSAGIGQQPSISISRATTYTASGATSTEAVNFTTTNWADTGAHLGTVGSKGSIVFDTKGRWWITAFLEITDASDGTTFPYLAHGLSGGGYTRLVHGTVAYAPNNVGNIAGGFVIDAAVGDYAQAGGQFFGGVSPGFSAGATSTRPSLLQAFLLKET